MDVTLYGYSKCGTCRSALKWLHSHGVEAAMVDLFETPPSADELRRFAEQSGTGLNKMFNVSGEVYREMNLKDKLPGMSESEKWDLLASNGRLIKRPIVTDGKKATVGFKEEIYEQAWGK